MVRQALVVTVALPKRGVVAMPGSDDIDDITTGQPRRAAMLQAMPAR